MKQNFEAVLEASGPKGAWTFMTVPFDATVVFGTKGRIAIAGTLNGTSFHNSLMPDGDGAHSMMVGKALQAAAGVKAGERVKVILWLDEEQRTIDPPDDLEAALRDNPAAQALFAAMTYSQRKEYVDWLDQARQAPTRASRVAKAVEMLAAGKKRTR